MKYQGESRRIKLLTTLTMNKSQTFENYLCYIKNCLQYIEDEQNLTAEQSYPMRTLVEQLLPLLIERHQELQSSAKLLEESPIVDRTLALKIQSLFLMFLYASSNNSRYHNYPPFFLTVVDLVLINGYIPPVIEGLVKLWHKNSELVNRRDGF